MDLPTSAPDSGQPLPAAADPAAVPVGHIYPPPADASAAPSPLPPEADTLGQTPHEPKTRPWELELLIAGGSVFALLQLPAQVSAWFHASSPTLSDSGFMAAMIGFEYVQMGVYALVAGFLVQLSVRAYWVCLIGLEAVFPHGIRWDKSRSGPIARDLQQRRVPPIQARIDASDRFASVVFSAAVGLALVFLISLLGAATLFTVAMVISRVFLGGTQLMPVAEVLFAVVMGPLFVLNFLDRRLGPKLDANGRAARVMRRLFTPYVVFQNWSLYALIWSTMFTNLRARRMGAAFGVTVAVLMGVFIVHDVLLPVGGVRADGYTYLPDSPGRLGVNPQYYEDAAPADAPPSTAPTIQSDMVRDPYVRLFLPYQPRRMNDAMAKVCPGVRALSSGTVRIALNAKPVSDADGEAALRCWARIQPVTLNGRPVPLRLRFYTHPKTGLGGALAYIPVDGLPRGENLLTIARPPSGEPGAKPDPPYYIPFWL